MSQVIHLLFKDHTTLEIKELSTFGRLTPGYDTISGRVSRIHIQIEPLSADDNRSNNGVNCAELTLKSHYLRITSNSISNTYTEPGDTIFLKHNDIINLVSNQHKNDQFMFTVHSPNPQIAKKKRNNDNSLLLSPTRKRRKYSLNNGNNDSILYDYNTNIMRDLSPNNNKYNNNNSNVLSLSGLMTSNFERSPSRNSSNPSPISSAKYNQFASFPISDNSLVIHKQLSHDLSSDDDDLLLNENEEKQSKIKINDEKEKKKQEQRLKEEQLFNEGRYNLAIPIIDCERYKFDIYQTMKVIANVLNQFMSIHRHPKLKIVVVASSEFSDIFYKTLLEEYGCQSLELEINDFDLDTKYKIFEADERIIIYCGEWRDIIKLKENGLCCQNLMNFTFWNFHARKGDKLNRLIHANCAHLSDLSIKKHQTAKKKCHCYSIQLNAENGGVLYQTQNIRNILQILAPNMNKKLNDFISNQENAYLKLKETYLKIFEAFYKSTQLKKPLNDKFIIKDVANWNNKSLIKKENVSLTQTNCKAMSLDIDAKNESKSNEESLHFSLKAVPKYNILNASEWPQFDGFWKNALSVYIHEKKTRDPKWNKCIFYEDEEYVIIYDRYFKAKIHLLLMPKYKIQSIEDLDPLNAFHISLIEGMIARAKWIKIGILARNKAINNIKYGFHCIPSMNHLHCHIISDDMDSKNLKNKKHFHSFTSNYFIPAKILLKVLKTEKRKLSAINKTYYRQLLKKELKCHFCFNEIKTIPALKKHIKQCQFAKNKRNQNKINFNNSFGSNSNNNMSDDEQNGFESFQIVFDSDNP